MTAPLRIALAQLNPTVGDVTGNMRLVEAAVATAREGGAHLVVCPELIVSGYPPEDLVMRPAYAAACRAAVEAFAATTADGPAVILSSPWPEGADPRPYNAIVLCAEGGVQAIRYKRQLPDYGVFDEKRTFRAGTETSPVDWNGVRLGLLLCEDMWYPEVTAALCGEGADILIAPHGSPFRRTAHAERRLQAEARVREQGRPLIFVNQVGGQDELVFDGGSFVCQSGAGGTDILAAPLFESGIYVTEWRHHDGQLTCMDGPQADWPEDEELVYAALVCGTRDYVRKSGFERVVIGLSGGIDSALVAAIAVDALGPEAVRCVMMPSRFTSSESLDDAADCAARLGVSYQTVPIGPGVGAFDDMLAPVFEGRAADVTEENIQSRIRGTLLMAISNKFGSLVLTTGNKSEMAVGYATLYGDMNGAYNPLKDVYKTNVFALAHWRNGARPAGALGPEGEVIPQRIIDKPPSAELREDQRDDDSLPPYEILDAILHGLVEEEVPVEALVRRGYEADTVRRVQHLLYIAEYKRRQAAPGPKVTSRNFGRDRRYPIVNRWRD
jgi:NAD+ synthase